MSLLLNALKLIIILSGLWFPYLGALLLLMDARFHLTSSEAEIKQDSPDWIIAKYFLDSPAFSVEVHRGIAMLLAISSITYLYYRLNSNSIVHATSNIFINFYEKLLMPVTLIIIFAGIFLKNVVLGLTGNIAFL